MNEEYYRRQAEANQEHEHQKNAAHPTLETYNLEQQEAHQGHIPSPQGASAEPQPSLWQRIRKMLGL